VDAATQALLDRDAAVFLHHARPPNKCSISLSNGA
jgi:hypothetical protein